jgi:hypothetical protein
VLLPLSLPPELKVQRPAPSSITHDHPRSQVLARAPKPIDSFKGQCHKGDLTDIPCRFLGVGPTEIFVLRQIVLLQRLKLRVDALISEFRNPWIAFNWRQ